MNSEIEVGEYVRTKDGKFGIFVRYSLRKDTSIYKSSFNCFVKLQNRNTNLQCHRDYILKHSKNLIDLLEVGDYVNGYQIMGFDDEYYDEDLDEVVKKESIILGNEEGMYTVLARDIETVATKEQFKTIEYVV